MKKLILLFSVFLFISFSALAQDSFLIGDWTYEKIPDSMEIGQEGRKMMDQFFAKSTISFEENNFSVSMMGKDDHGTWRKLDGDKYELYSSVAGSTNEVSFSKVSDDQIIFTFAEGKSMQMKRSGKKKKPKKKKKN
jgi:hypothetical protein